ncbi:polyprenyl synthetase family protein [Nocardia jiangsuensis]|uniref:Polyprenyl synthetase family protein n=1 Tax=Nocardia jiangsuensis TaxID=1691563 RepID=A0ABV8E083_9NOCA
MSAVFSEPQRVHHLLTTPDGEECSPPRWRAGVRTEVTRELESFVQRNQPEPISGIPLDGVLRHYALGGKCLRPMFLYLGWLCGADPSPAALRAAAALELLQAFALLQDDVMDEAELRRGEPAAHRAFAAHHRELGLPGDAARFGESAATLLGDLCLVWSERMLRESGIDERALTRMWPRYDRMRVELALGQFADLVNDARVTPTLESVLAIARAKSGNYTVRRPLELGALMAGCQEQTVEALSRYGTLVGEAFQLRDDVLGVYGSAETTGKPADSDLGQRKATTVVVAAQEMADPATARALAELLAAPALDAAAVTAARALISATGAAERIEAMITERVTEARDRIRGARIDEPELRLLDGMALICTTREL